MATAFEATLNCLRAIVDALDFDLVDPRTARGTSTRPLVPKYALLALPLAVNIIPLDHTYRLICATTMSKKLFWQYVDEKLELGDELDKYSGDRLTIETHRVKKFSPVWPSNGKVVLCFLPYMDLHFDSQQRVRIRDGMIRLGWHATCHNTQLVHLTTAYDAQRLNRQIASRAQSNGLLSAQFYQKFADAYHAMRNWMLDNGLLSAQLHMVTEEILISLLGLAFAELDLSAASDEEWIGRVLKTSTFSNPIQHGLEIYAPSGQCLTANLHSGVSETFQRLALRRIAQERHDSTLSVDQNIIPSASQSNADPGRDSSVGLTGFLRECDYFLKVYGVCWGSPKIKTQFSDTMAAMILSLNVGNRIWPLPFFRGEGNSEIAYLIGFYPEYEWETKRSKPPNPYIIGRAFHLLQYDRSVSAVNYEILVRGEAEQYVLQATEQESYTTSVSPSQDTRFRTAAAVMARLRWDEMHATTEYEIGYIDRFQKELMWKALEKWEKHTEEEEFVPEHRIMKIRRVADEVVVWDRKARFDGT